MPKTTAPARSKKIAESTAFWRTKAISGLDFFKATFIEHVYSRHTHDEYAIALTERGTQTFTLRGGSRLAPPGSLNVINPNEAHDGCSATGEAYTYRMMYIAPDTLVRLVDNDRKALSSSRFPLFNSPIIEDRKLAVEYLRLHCAFESGLLGVLEAESRIMSFLTPLVTLYADFREPASNGRHTPLVQLIREYLENHFQEDPSLADLSQLTGLGRFALLRQFKREVGLPPHGYLNQVRLREARRRLLAGVPPALVAAEVGFVDQSHLIKRFRSALGMTPGQYRAAG